MKKTEEVKKIIEHYQKCYYEHCDKFGIIRGLGEIDGRDFENMCNAIKKVCDRCKCVTGKKNEKNRRN